MISSLVKKFEFILVSTDIWAGNSNFLIIKKSTQVKKRLLYMYHFREISLNLLLCLSMHGNLKCGFRKKSFIMNAPLVSWASFHHFWVGATANPPKSDEKMQQNTILWMSLDKQHSLWVSLEKWYSWITMTWENRIQR